MATTGDLFLIGYWDGMSNLYKGPSMDASYQVSDHLDKWFQRRRFLERSIYGKSSVTIAHFVPIR
jgi:hypothetical protein